MEQGAELEPGHQKLGRLHGLKLLNNDFDSTHTSDDNSHVFEVEVGRHVESRALGPEAAGPWGAQEIG